MIKVELKTDPLQINPSATSKGNQPKWYQDGYWYKADHFGYESLSEFVCSRFMAYSNLTNYVEYELCEIHYDGRIYRGCRSKSYNENNYDIIPLEKFVRLQSTVGLASIMGKLGNVSDRIEYVSEFVRKNTDITDFEAYLSDLLLIDALFLNEDRHTNNIVMIRNAKTNEWKMSPVFDMGAALFSDTRCDYPLNADLEECYKRIKAKPFSEDFDEQLDEAEKIYRSSVNFDFKGKSVRTVVDSVFNEVPVNENGDTVVFYSQDEINRVRDVIIRQFRKYSYIVKQTDK